MRQDTPVSFWPSSKNTHLEAGDKKQNKLAQLSWMKRSNSMNSAEQKCFLNRSCNCLLMLTALNGSVDAKAGYTHCPGIPGTRPKWHKIPAMRGLLSSSSQAGSSVVVLLSCKICHFGKQKITVGSTREKGERWTAALLTSWLIPSLELVHCLFAISALAVRDTASKTAAFEETNLH